MLLWSAALPTKEREGRWAHSKSPAPSIYSAGLSYALRRLLLLDGQCDCFAEGRLLGEELTDEHGTVHFCLLRFRLLPRTVEVADAGEGHTVVVSGTLRSSLSTVEGVKVPEGEHLSRRQASFRDSVSRSSHLYEGVLGAARSRASETHTPIISATTH